MTLVLAVLVELFTSQGCSSCPPADRLLSRLAREAGVVALAFHVDYWNGLGWEDPYSRAAFSERQRRYGERLSRRGVYTPQMVIAGRTDAVGSDERAVRQLLADEARRPPGARLRGRLEGARPLRVTVAAESLAAHELRVWAAIVEDGLVTPIGRGENAGRTLTNDRVVRRLEEVLVLAPGARSSKVVSWPVAPGWKREGLSVVLFAQDPKTLRIEGAVEIR
jgi:hypothetical protein